VRTRIEFESGPWYSQLTEERGKGGDREKLKGNKKDFRTEGIRTSDND